jgi:hypothetical protein
LLFNNTLHISKRIRRGLINGVGTLPSFLFGVLDDVDPKSIANDINSVKTAQRYLFSLMKNQTSIVEATN